MSTDPLQAFVDSEPSVAMLAKIRDGEYDLENPDDHELIHRLRIAGLAYTVNNEGRRFAHLKDKGRTLLERNGG